MPEELPEIDAITSRGKPSEMFAWIEFEGGAEVRVRVGEKYQLSVVDAAGETVEEEYFDRRPPAAERANAIADEYDNVETEAGLRRWWPGLAEALLDRGGGDGE